MDTSSTPKLPSSSSPHDRGGPPPRNRLNYLPEEYEESRQQAVALIEERFPREMEGPEALPSRLNMPGNPVQSTSPGTSFKNISSTASHAVAAISKERFDSPVPRMSMPSRGSIPNLVNTDSQAANSENRNAIPHFEQDLHSNHPKELPSSRSKLPEALHNLFQNLTLEHTPGVSKGTSAGLDQPDSPTGRATTKRLGPKGCPLHQQIHWPELKSLRRL